MAWDIHSVLKEENFKENKTDIYFSITWWLFLNDTCLLHRCIFFLGTCLNIVICCIAWINCSKLECASWIEMPFFVHKTSAFSVWGLCLSSLLLVSKSKLHYLFWIVLRLWFGPNTLICSGSVIACFMMWVRSEKHFY